MQQDLFTYLNARGAGRAATVPDFEKVIGLVMTSRASSLSALPAHWYNIVSCPKPRVIGVAAPANAPREMQGTGAGVAVNAHADSKLMRHYKESGHASISAMVGGRSLEYPKHAGQPVCMAWALKGTCAPNCKRAAQHQRYGKAVVTALHKFLDDCGVANPQT
jgi:hypothetical protein